MASRDQSGPHRPGSDSSTFMPLGDLRAYVQIVKRRKWSLILVILLTMSAAAFFTYRQTPLYQSSATVLVKPLSPSQLLQGYNYNFSVSMQTEEALMTAPDVENGAAQLAAQQGASSASHSVSTDVPTDTTFLTVTVSSPDPQQAQIWANAYANAYIAYRSDQAKKLYESAQAGFTQQLSTVKSDLDEAKRNLANATTQTERATASTAVDTLEKTFNTLSQQAASVPYPVSTTAAQVIAPATLPTTPYSPSWVKNMIIAFVVGLALGFAVVFIRERLDDRLAGREDLEEQAGAPVLAIVPKIPGWKKKNSTRLVARDMPKTPPAEAYRTLRTNVNFLAKTSDLRSISLASPSMGEGKTTTSANLAVALAQTGKRVIAVSCDLRKPRLHRFFDLTNDRGVTSILRDDVPITAAAQRVPGVDTLRVIASGPVPHDPSEMLGSEEMEQLLKDLRNYADYVIIDTAPVLVVSDALQVAPKTDGVILIVDASSTMRGAVAATREQLEMVGSNIVGAIFNDFDPARAKMYYGSYKYHYYGNYEYRDPEERRRSSRSSAPVDPSDLWR